ncbi:type II toxin-antitoxin system HipA family toxin [Novosphingobium sp. G106]|uniref:type II toxin-antitoxin system HipA family toxin n=1 Tax=Novosphingobium sp. G106 TaxID=2849500 RepID=UPI001C2CE8FB|nr:type II toxin-antitoxin system HipA family toxin [Novosphingobium sp. G106]MBV1692045.1 type II toxin-antitoxin system HipA family toxin [Novosphingobium sp. G106]
MSLPMQDVLAVWWGERIAGELAIDRGGAMHFAYAAEWLDDAAASPLSQALPKQAEPFGDSLCNAVFGGLLPEEGQRTAIARALGVSPDNPFRLLAALGGDVAGALAFLPAGVTPPEPPTSGHPVQPLSELDLAALIEGLPRAPMLAGQGGARLSLAGAQEKLPVVLDAEGAIAVPRPGEPSTHLIKPEPERFPGLAANEAFCLALARITGLDAARAEWRSAEGRPLLLVTRYDRFANGAGAIIRLHQEDFAQALGVPSNRKYAAEGGPAFRDAFALLRQAATRPAREVLKLADAALFNLLIGNADAHAKNFSLLRGTSGMGAGDIVLSPFYDLVATRAWPDLAPRLAMRFGGAASLEDVEADSFVRFAADAGLTAPFVRRRAAALARAVEDAIAAGVEVAGLADPAMVATLAAQTTERAGRLALKATST